MSETVVFFGSGPVAAESLRLLSEHFEIEALVTKPSTLKEMADTIPGIPGYAVSNKAELDSLIDEKLFKSQLAILIDFGIIVSRKVIDYFPLGIVNSHFSLLPRLRGADPITFAILNGDTKSGVSLMLLDEQMDTGKLIAQKSLAVEPEDTTGTLTAKLIGLSAELLQQYLPGYVSGDVKPRSQPHPDRATYSRKLTKEDGVVDWNKPAAQLEREVRAYMDWPKSVTTLAGKEVILRDVVVAAGDGNPGTVYVEGKQLLVATGDGRLEIRKLKPAGKNEMTAQAFLAGHKHLL